MTCGRCEMLQARVHELEDALGLMDESGSAGVLLRMRKSLRLTWTEAGILVRLYAANGHAVMSEALIEHAGITGTGTSLKVHVSRIRKYLGKGVIERVPGVPAYRLTPSGRALLLPVIQPEAA